MDLLKVKTAKSFVGADFLTWLWFASEESDGRFEIEDVGEVTVIVDDQIVLSAEHSDARENVLRKGSPALCAEAGAALAVGKKVARLKIRIETDEADLLLTLDSDDLDARGLRIPNSMGPTTVEKVIERSEWLLVVSAILDGLFSQFLAARLGKGWEKGTLEKMRGWVRVKDGEEAASCVES